MFLGLLPVVSPEVTTPYPRHVTSHVLKHTLGSSIVEKLGAVAAVTAQLLVGTHAHQKHPCAASHALSKTLLVKRTQQMKEEINFNFRFRVGCIG
jgi:hypothetical protein